VLLLAAGGAAAEEPKQPERSEEPPALNLKLDNPGKYARETPQEEKSALPSLGDTARPIPTTPMPTTTRPFPNDSERPDPR
jgi:hypothetical protein